MVAFVGDALGFVALVKGFCPEGPGDGLADPLDEALAEEGGADEAPMHPALLAAAFGDRGDAGILLHRSRVGEALSVLSEGCEQTRGQSGASAGELLEDGGIGEFGARGLDGVVEALDGLVHLTELADEAPDHQDGRLDDGRVLREGAGLCDGLEALFDDGGMAEVALTEKGPEGLWARPLECLEDWPPFDEVQEDIRELVSKEAQNQGMVGFEMPREAVGQAGAVLHQLASILHEAAELTHLRLQGEEPLGVPQDEVGSEEGIGGVVLRPGRRESLAVLGEAISPHREQHEAVVLEEGGHHRAPFELEMSRLDARPCRAIHQIGTQHPYQR